MNLLHRKESIVLTAIDIIGEFGIQGLTTREIACRQGISEGTIFRHFKNKNEIVMEVLNHFSQFDRDIMDSLRIRDLGTREAIRYYIKSYVEYYSNYPQVVYVLYLYDGLLNEEELAEKIKNIFKMRRQVLKYIMDEGKNRGDICHDIDSEALVDIVEGSFRLIIDVWRMDGYSFPLKERVLSTLDTILDKILEV